MKHRQIGANRVGVMNPDGHVIGLDIGATSVRAAVLAPGTLEGRPSVTVHGLGRVDLPLGSVVNGIVTDRNAVAAAIKHLWTVQKFECHNVILGIANQQVLVRDLTVPHLSPQQMAKALPYQAREIVALPMDQVILDFAQLGEPDPETNMVNGLLLATPREPVLAAVAAVEHAGLQVARVDLSSFATLRSIGDEHLGVEAIIDLGAHLTTVVIHDRGMPKLVRTLTRGSQEITEQLASRLDIGIVEAEQAKLDVGLAGDSAQARVLREAVRPLIAELRTSIGYFRSTVKTASLERISLTGGGAWLRELPKVMGEQLGLPVSHVDPMQHIRNRTSKQALVEEVQHDSSAVSLGLAMGAAA
jgi:type IV pilus assembly protein PilM